MTGFPFVLGFGLQLLLQPLPVGETGVASGKKKTRKIVCLFDSRFGAFRQRQKATICARFFA